MEMTKAGTLGEGRLGLEATESGLGRTEDRTDRKLSSLPVFAP